MRTYLFGFLCKRLAVVFMGLFVLLSIAACGRNANTQPWHLLDITGSMPPLRFTLLRDDGQTVNQKDYLGKTVLLYFGYTHCTDVCPTTLADLGSAISKLGPAADQVRVLFVSVDPGRDTPAVLKNYVKQFGPWFVGLSGSQQQLLDITKRYRVAYRLGKPDSQGNYEVFHSSAVFIFDRHGNARLLASQSDKPGAIAADLRRLLSG